MAVRLSDLRARRPPPPPPGRFLAIISVTGWVDLRAIVRLEGLGKLKKIDYLIGNQSRNLPDCSVVSQPTTLPRAPAFLGSSQSERKMFGTKITEKIVPCILFAIKFFSQFLRFSRYLNKDC
jgi:hypothetical protein